MSPYVYDAKYHKDVYVPTIADQFVEENVALTKNTIISNVSLIGDGAYTVPQGKTLVITGSFNAPLKQVFFGSGSVVFSSGMTVYPEWWGAEGDGVTDDTTAIQAADTSTSGGITWLTAGRNYACNAVFISNSVMGSGTVTQKTAGINLFTIQASDIFIDGPTFVGLDTADTVERGIYCNEEYHRNTIRNCTFTGFTHAIDVNGSTLTNSQYGWDISFNRFKDIGTNSSATYGYGILLPDVDHFNVIGNIFKTINRHAIYLSAGSRNCIISKNNIDGVTESDAIKVYSTTGQDRCKDNIISENIIDNAVYGVNITQGSDYNLVLNNKFKNITDIGVYINGASGGLYPVGNIVDGNDFQGAFVESPIYIQNAESNIIRNNTGFDIDSDFAAFIYITDYFGSQHNTWTTTSGWIAEITNNRFSAHDATTYGIILNYTGNTDPVYIDNNSFRVSSYQTYIQDGGVFCGYHDMKTNDEVSYYLTANSATPNVRGMRTGRTNCSTGTSVTDLLGGFPGQLLTIYGDDGANTTFVHAAAKINLPGGSNITLANNDTLSLVCEDGTVWHCVAYSDNTP